MIEISLIIFGALLTMGTTWLKEHVERRCQNKKLSQIIKRDLDLIIKVVEELPIPLPVNDSSLISHNTLFDLIYTKKLVFLKENLIFLGKSPKEFMFIEKNNLDEDLSNFFWKFGRKINWYLDCQQCRAFYLTAANNYVSLLNKKSSYSIPHSQEIMIRDMDKENIDIILYGRSMLNTAIKLQESYLKTAKELSYKISFFPKSPK